MKNFKQIICLLILTSSLYANVPTFKVYNTSANNAQTVLITINTKNNIKLIKKTCYKSVILPSIDRKDLDELISINLEIKALHEDQPRRIEDLSMTLQNKIKKIKLIKNLPIAEDKNINQRLFM